jgi:hypothetical protein
MLNTVHEIEHIGIRSAIKTTSGYAGNHHDQDTGHPRNPHHCRSAVMKRINAHAWLAFIAMDVPVLYYRAGKVEALGGLK